MNLRALFCDETADYKTPYQPMPGDTLTLSFRTDEADDCSVTLLSGDRSFPLTPGRGRDGFVYHTVTLPVGERPFSYRFRVTAGGESVEYDRLGCREVSDGKHDFSFLPGVKVPEWALGTVYYQIFVDRFRNGDPANDVTGGEYLYAGRPVCHTDEWWRTPTTFDVANFSGGDLAGVLEKLGYLASLGVKVVYFNPLFVSPSNHKYDVQDYDHIDPHFGVILRDGGGEDKNAGGFSDRYLTRVLSEENLAASDALFAKLVGEMHRLGMRVVIDGVFNHCGSYNKWMDREGIYRGKPEEAPGAFHGPASPYRSFFSFDETAPAGYECWWGHTTLPKLCYENSPALESEVLRIGRKWLGAPYFVDGWRLDVAADLGHSPAYNHTFWKNFKREMRKENPDALLLAEHYGDPSSYLSAGEWDTVMNYDAFMEPVSFFLTGMEKHSDAFLPDKLFDGEEFFRAMGEGMSRFPRPALDAAMNQLSNHDHSRFLTRTSRRVGRLATAGAEAAMEGIRPAVMKLAVLLQMTWPGSPAIYYGDEAGQVGWTDPDSRRTYPWGHENGELLDFHKEAVALRGRIPCLALGSIKPLLSGKGYIAYARFNAKSATFVVINPGPSPLTLHLPVREAGVADGSILYRALSTRERAKNEKVTASCGVVTVGVPAESGVVYTTDPDPKEAE